MKYVIDIDLDNPAHNCGGGRKSYVDAMNGAMWELSPALQDKLRRLDNKIADNKTERVEQKPKMVGWICPVCGRGLSPFTSVCPCNAGKGWEITCRT